MLKYGNFKLPNGKTFTENTVLLQENFYVQTSVYKSVLTIRKINKSRIKIVKNLRGQKSHIERR